MTRQMQVHLFRRLARAGGHAPGLLLAEFAARLDALLFAIVDRALKEELNPDEYL